MPLFAAVSTVPNARVEVLGPESIRVSWDPVYQDMVSRGTLLGFKIYYQSAGEPLRTINTVESTVQHVIPALSELRHHLTLKFDIVQLVIIYKYKAAASVCLCVCVSVFLISQKLAD